MSTLFRRVLRTSAELDTIAQRMTGELRQLVPWQRELVIQRVLRAHPKAKGMRAVPLIGGVRRDAVM